MFFIPSIKKALLFCLLLSSFTSEAQTQFTFALANQASTSNTFEFDLMITVPSGGRRIYGLSAGVNFNASILNGGTPCTTNNCGSYSIVAGTTATELTANGGLNPPSLAYTSASSHLRFIQSTKAASLVDLAAGTYRIARFKFTNTANWTTNSNANLWLSPIGGSVTNTSVSQAAFGGGTIVTLTTVTTPAVILTNTSTSTFSIPLNAAPTCPTEATASSFVAESPCAGAANGSALITLTGAPSATSAVTYSVDGGATQNATLSASAFTVSGLSAGSHVVAVTYPTCTAVSTSSFTIGAGDPATTIGTESQTVCGTSYTWPTSGATYNSSGSYTHVVGCNTATLNLTLTPPTTTGSESQTVCGTSYTWPTSGATYNASGSYTHVIGCNTATLTLTLTPSTTTGSESQTVCGTSYTWPTSGLTYNSSGSYTHVVGCNTATLTLTLTPSTTTGSESQTVCGTSYTWPTSGLTYNSSGSYTHVVGCNTATLTLTLTPTTTTGSESQAVCGTSYTWPTSGLTYNSSGSYTHVVGCNTATLTLTLTPSSTNTTTISASGTYTWANNGQTYSASGTYTGNVVNCVIQVLDLTITPVQSGVLSLKVYLEGYYLSAGQMRSALVNSGVGTNNAISDTIKVQLRSQSSPNASVLSTNVLLSTNGTASISIPPSLIGGNYYIAVYHRNSLETWSSIPIAITANTDFDFTTSSSQAYGAASMKQVEAGVWALYSGDHNQDGAITPSDLGSVATEASLFSFGYIKTDLTGDGAIDGFDLGLADNNSHALLVSSHP